jgi:hypothetical protein
MTEKRNQREHLWFQTGGALNFITAAPHCGNIHIGTQSHMAKETPGIFVFYISYSLFIKINLFMTQKKFIQMKKNEGTVINPVSCRNVRLLVILYY